MHADTNDRSKVYAKMKAIRNEKSRTTTRIITPVGEYIGDNILEGFAAEI